MFLLQLLEYETTLSWFEYNICLSTTPKKSCDISTSTIFYLYRSVTSRKESREG